MARLQDFQTVTPTSSDKLLVVQSQGQGLVPYGSKLDSANPTGTGSLSLNRSGSTGANSVAVNSSNTASGSNSFAAGGATTASASYAFSAGYQTKANADWSTAFGYMTEASGQIAFAEGNRTEASGSRSHAEGLGTEASRASQHVFGEYNVKETGDATTRGTYVEIVGNGTSTTPSNARTLDWSGNEVLAGDLTFNGNISLNTLTTLLRGMTTFTINSGASKTVTVVGTELSFLVVGVGWSSAAGSVLMHIGGYVAASRCLVTNITGVTGLTIDNSSTSSLAFVFTNTISSSITIRLIPLFDNTFTVT